MEITAATEEDKPRIINLFCPSFSTILPFAAYDQHRLDIGSIATAFGLEPSSVKLNGYFISRGVDFISFSVTWKSLLSFFSSKGLPIGMSHKDPIFVYGKPTKVGVKRAYGSHEIVDDEEGCNFDVKKKKKVKYWELGSKEVEHFPVSKCNPNSYKKRKQYMEDVILLKKLKINETKSDVGGINDTAAYSIPRTAYSCSYNSENMKRMREDEPLLQEN